MTKGYNIVTASSMASLEKDRVKSSGGSNSNGLTPCYLMVADILGFSQMITKLTDDQQRQRVDDWVDLVQTTQRQLGITDTQLMSDTLFVREEDSEDGLERLLRFAQLLLQNGIEMSFPIRGAIVHGNVAWGKLTYGEAVIQAHKIERSLDWIGIACSATIPRIDKFWSWDLVVLYPPPQYSWSTQQIPAIAWDVPRSQELAAKVIDLRLYQLGEIIPGRVISKLEHTVQFGIYLRLGKSRSLNPKTFRGLSIMQFLESEIERLSRASR